MRKQITMKKGIFRIVFTLMLNYCFSTLCISQTLAWNVNLNKPETFTSLNPKEDPGVTEDMMWQVSIRDIMGYSTERDRNSYGIFATPYDNNKVKVEVSVFLYDPEAVIGAGRGPLLYRCYMDKTNDPNTVAANSYKYEYGSWLAWWPHTPEFNPEFYFNDDWESTDARTAALAAARYNFRNRFSSFKQKGGIAVVPPIPPDADIKLPVIIELTVYKANVKGISLPGLGVIQAGFFKPPYLDMDAFTTKVYNNGVDFNIVINEPITIGTSFSNIKINLSPFGDMNSTPLESFEIPAKSVPYKNSFQFRFPETRGQFWLWANYDLTVIGGDGKTHSYPNRKQFLFNYVSADEDVPGGFDFAYAVNKTNYNGLPVFTLRGGMSAEYGVEKSLASLSSGISETWDVRTVNGKPDLADGGPVSVYPHPNEFNFLERSVDSTVSYYDQYLGKDTYFETVIIGTGVAHVPYLSNAMKAPFLPIHFLVSTHSVAEVKRILDAAADGGFSAYSTSGYDPSINDVGVTWIKLRDLPRSYKDFLIRHKVKNVILMGYRQGVAEGEAGARRIWIDGQINDDFSPGSMYMMGHGEPSTYKSLYKDFYKWNFGEEELTSDWEGGLTDVQVENFTKSVSAAGLTPYTIRADGSGNFYRWALDVQLYLLNKMGKMPRKISMNEYLIAYPEYELWQSTVPFLYWQGLAPGTNAFKVYDFAGFKLNNYIPSGSFPNMPVYIQAKANRTPLLDELKKYFTNVTMDAWQKADIWNPSDGMNTPCELAAVDIVNNGGAAAFADWNNKRAVIGFDDFSKIAASSTKPAPPSYKDFPKPSSVTTLKNIPQAGLQIVNYNYEKNEYWHPANYPNDIELSVFAGQYPGKSLGYLDGQETPNDIRRQSINICQFDLGNSSDEYDLRLGYKFNIDDKDGLTSYNPELGDEQEMDCFEFTSVPYNHWFDIPSRMMAKSGAVMIVNGGVYDFDYNGLPGVVPFIKKNNDIKAQPQILSYKGEGAVAWNWGKQKKVSILSRPAVIPPTGLAATMANLFRNPTSEFSNVMGGMTFMTKDKPYNILDLQPDWMKNYPPFPLHYLTEGQRCFFAPLSLNCGGTEVVAPINQGWNDCSSLSEDNAIQRFSTLAYRQYPKIFDAVPNARTFVGIKGNQLDIGIINGDYGKKGLRGRIATKTIGMHNYEVSQFCQYRQYDYMVNLDGGSSTQMWLNGRGPLQMLNSYVLGNDNQGPYYSRLLSSFVMLVPKIHTELIKSTVMPVNKYLVPDMDNTSINFNYSDAADLNKDKAFIDLSVCKDSLNRQDGQFGYIAGNFSMSRRNVDHHGGVLFYIGEDMYYPDTKGLKLVQPSLRNLMVIGVGMVPPSLVDSLLHLTVNGNVKDFGLAIQSTTTSAYYIKVYNGVVIEYIIGSGASSNGNQKYLTGDHWFSIRSDKNATTAKGQNLFFVIDGEDLGAMGTSVTQFSAANQGFLKTGECTHAYMGALNLDGRFITGDINMKLYNFVFAAGKPALTSVSPYLQNIERGLKNFSLPNLAATFFEPGVYVVQGQEGEGQHVFALSPKNQNRFYGLRLNNYLFFKKNPGKSSGKKSVKQ